MKKVRDIFRVRNVLGLKVGIELEFEGDRLPSMDYDEDWKRVEDGSLRPPCGEYVLRHPMDVDTAIAAVDKLYSVFKQSKTKLRDTVRAGVHIHINCQDLTMTQLYSFMTLYLVMEEVLVEWCGESRAGNLFCLRAGDAETLLHQLDCAACDHYFLKRFKTDDLRYASMNVKALTDYGSLEFRSMKSTDNADLLKTWINMLVAVRMAAMNYSLPTSIIEDYSMIGPIGLMEKTFGKELTQLLLCKDVEKKLFDGMRNAQQIAYATNWEVMEKILNKPRTNPFEQEYDIPAVELAENHDRFMRADMEAAKQIEEANAFVNKVKLKRPVNDWFAVDGGEI